MNLKINDQQAKTLLWIALGVVGLVIVIKLVKKTGEALNIFDTKEEKKAEETTKQAIKEFEKEANRTSKPTRTAAQWALVADTIYNALKASAVSDNKAKAYTELARILTDADMAAVVKAFGNRQEYSFGIPIGSPKTLIQFVQDNFSNDDIADLNDLYRKSKMRFKF